VSFGGQANTPLDVACPTAAALTSAYQSVISDYKLTTIDLDIEGSALDNFAAEQRRAAAIAALEKSDPHLNVWLTLPVEPDGLQDDAISVIESMLRDHVSIAGVNVMTMDFSSPPASGSTMAGSAEDALDSVAGQIASLYPKYGIHLRSQQIWQRLGTIWAGSRCGRLTATASAARPSPRRVCCPTPAAAPPRPVGSSPRSSGSCRAARWSRRARARSSPPPADTNPTDAPFPQWSAAADYPLGYKVAEDGEIYQAKWYNSGDDPAAQVQFAYQTPWELPGPVLPGDHGPNIRRVPAGSYPAWSIGAQYAAGDKVLYQGLPYQAKWSNEGVSPATESTDSSGSPWKALYVIPGEPTGGPVVARSG
jgi:chitinase